MANIKSAEKKNRQRIRHEARNKTHKSAMRTAVKKVRSGISAKDAGAAAAALKEAIKLLDRAASKGVIKKRTASRSVARLTTALNSLRA